MWQFMCTKTCVSLLHTFNWISNTNVPLNKSSSMLYSQQHASYAWLKLMIFFLHINSCVQIFFFVTKTLLKLQTKIQSLCIMYFIKPNMFQLLTLFYGFWKVGLSTTLICLLTRSYPIHVCHTSLVHLDKQDLVYKSIYIGINEFNWKLKYTSYRLKDISTLLYNGKHCNTDKFVSIE